MKLNVLFFTLLIGLCLAVAPSGAVSVYLQNGMQLTTYITTPATPDTNSMSRVVVDGDVYDFGRDGNTGKLLGRVSCSNYATDGFAGLTGAGTTRSGVITRFTMPFQYPFNTPADNFVRWYRIANRGTDLTGRTMAFAFNTSEQDGVVQPFAMKRWYASAWTDYNNGAGGDTGADGDVDIVNATIPGSGSATPAVSDWIYVHYQSSLAVIYAKLCLEGPYIDTGSAGDPIMDTRLQTWYFGGNAIPLTSPFADHRVAPSIPTNAVDWIYIGLINHPWDWPTALEMRSGFLDEDGNVLNTDGSIGLPMATTNVGNYYIIVYHRNHLQVASASLIDIGNLTPTNPYNFTSGADKYFEYAGARGAEDLGTRGIWGLIAADGNRDFAITTQDNNVVYSNQGAEPYEDGDYNFSTQVETGDNNVYYLNQGKECPWNIPH